MTKTRSRAWLLVLGILMASALLTAGAKVWVMKMRSSASSWTI